MNASTWYHVFIVGKPKTFDKVSEQCRLYFFIVNKPYRFTFFSVF